jgi:hypothetical protein
MNVSSDELSKRRKTMSTQETTIAKTRRTNSKKAQGSKARSKSAAKEPKATKPSKAPKKTAKAAQDAGQGEARSGSKTAIVLDLMRRKEGATLAEIAKATDWQNHSIRGHVIKRLVRKVESTKCDAGERTYRMVT